MRLGYTLLVGLGIAGAAGLSRAQPEQELRAALDQLLRAGNYTWEEKHQRENNSRVRGRSLSHASGETSVGGYTSAQIGRVQVVMLDRETAFALQKGWRHFKDLTDDDIAELRARPSAFGATARSYVHPLPHELLELLVQAARNTRKESGALLAEVDSTLLDPGMLEKYLRTGALPAAHQSRNVVGLPVPGTNRSRGSGSSAGNEHATFFVWVEQGQISRFSVEFSRSVTFLNGPSAGTQEVLRIAYILELSRIGTTKVDIAPEAKALFLGATGGR